jgi:uncharacterized protein YgiB involved in biofilm formation
MKRSHAIMLGAGGLLAAAALWPSPDPKEDVLAYKDVDECIAAGIISSDICKTQFDQAEAQHVAAAPKFENQTTCEAQYGAANCTQKTSNGSSFFVPLMTGMLISQFLNNRNPLAQPLYPPTQQNFRGGSGGSGGSSAMRGYSTATGWNFRRDSALRSGTVTAPRSVISPSANTVSRGGFGSKARGFSVGG